ncbi:RNA-directed DNA polymerase (reverse transcriptase), partial [Trifolium pratense]
MHFKNNDPLDVGFGARPAVNMQAISNNRFILLHDQGDTCNSNHVGAPCMDGVGGESQEHSTPNVNTQGEEANGHSGGIWVLSHLTNLDVSLVDSRNQVITFTIRRQDAFWHCSAVYASPGFLNRRTLWDYLKHLRSTLIGPWLLVGDFNEILLSNEVAGGSFNHTRASLFGDMLTDCNLLDLHT